MCGSKRSLIFWTAAIASVAAFVVYVAVTFHPKAPGPAQAFVMNEESWGGTTVATGHLFPDRASTTQVTGIVLMRASPEAGRYLRFESIRREGPEAAMLLVLTGAAFPTDLKQNKYLPVELAEAPNGLFMKTGSFNQAMPGGVDFKGFRGAILWNVADQTLVANVAFDNR
jgi:hypothetical protein